LGTYYEDMERYFEKLKEGFINNKLIYKKPPHVLHMCHGLGDTHKTLQLIFHKFIICCEMEQLALSSIPHVPRGGLSLRD
jgi:hypothetical protein